MNKATFAGVCTILSTLPSQTKWEDASASVYLAIMKEWDDRVVGATMRHVLLRCEFRPTVAEINKIAMSLFSDIPTDGQAILYIQRVITRWASNRDEHAHDIHPVLPLIVKQAGGWTSIGMSDNYSAHSRVKDAYDYVMATHNFEHYLTNPVENDKTRQLLQSGSSTAKAISE